MYDDTCSACGKTYSAESREALMSAALDHFNEVHPDWGLNKVAIENYYDAKDRLSTRTERLDSIGTVEVHRVDSQNVEECLDFFDRDAFAGNPEWAACYCMFFHREEPQTNGSNSWRQNRSELAERLRTGETTAYLAYIDGKPAGWCNASLRSAYPTRRTGVDDDDVGVVACFAIAPPYRRHGISRKLLVAAIEGFRARGVTRVEAHPHVSGKEAAHNYRGPLALYLDAGFEIVEQDDRSALVSMSI